MSSRNKWLLRAALTALALLITTDRPVRKPTRGNQNDNDKKPAE